MTDALIATYSPNIDCGKHVVEIVLKCWAYERTEIVRVGGNTRGFDVMETAAELLAERIVEDVREFGYGKRRLRLTSPEGEGFHADFEDEGDRYSLEDDWIKTMIVSIRIVGWEAPTLNQVRARHGAAPLPDGDRPWEPL